MHSHIRFVLATPLILLTAGCANVSGAPRSVIPAGQLQQLVTSADYDVEATLVNFYSVDPDDRDQLSRQDYRDMVAGLYLAAADANYQRFRSALGSSSRGSSVGFDTVSLLLTGLAASSSGNRAQDLATAATALTGFRTSFDRNLLFDRTIPAIIASMDAERARTRASIVERLRLDATAYPLPQFFADIQAYELSATLEQAIGRVNETANNDRDDANRTLDRALVACDLEENIAPQIAALRNAVRVGDATQQRTNLNAAAGALDVAVADSDSNDVIWVNIAHQVESGYCTSGGRATAIARVLQAVSSQ